MKIEIQDPEKVLRTLDTVRAKLCDEVAEIARSRRSDAQKALLVSTLRVHVRRIEDVRAELQAGLLLQARGSHE